MYADVITCCTYVCRSEVVTGPLPLLISTLSSETGFLIEPGTCHFSWSGWPASPYNLAISFPSVGITDACLHTQLSYIGSGDLKPGAHLEQQAHHLSSHLPSPLL